MTPASVAVRSPSTLKRPKYKKSPKRLLVPFYFHTQGLNGKNRRSQGVFGHCLRRGAAVGHLPKPNHPQPQAARTNSLHTYSRPSGIARATSRKQQQTTTAHKSSYYCNNNSNTQREEAPAAGQANNPTDTTKHNYVAS